MTGGRKVRWGLLIRAAAGLGLLILALRGMDWRQVGGALVAVDWRWAIAALASILLSLGLKALRWQYLLRGAAPRSHWPNLLGALLAGQAVNIVLPVRGGELSRAWLVSPASASRVGIVAAIGAEKVFDLVALTTLALGWLPSAFASGVSADLYPAWTGGAVSLAGVAGLWALVWWGEPVWQSARRRLQSWSAAAGQARGWRSLPLRWGDEVLSGLRPLRSPGVFLPAAGLTAIIWASMLVTNLLLFTAFRLNAPPLAGITVLVLIHVGLLPAVMPGNIGPFYFFTRVALAPFGVPGPVALSYAVTLHALVVLPPLVGGGLFLLASQRKAADSPAG